jgi:hypothetical protein
VGKFACGVYAIPGIVIYAAWLVVAMHDGKHVLQPGGAIQSGCYEGELFT